MRKLIAIGVLMTLTACGIGSSGQSLSSPQTSTSTASASVSVPSNSEPPGVLPLAVTQPVANPAVNDSNVTTTICTGTSKYRPPVSYTNRVKYLELHTPVGKFASITDPRNGKIYKVPGYSGYAGLGPTTSPGDVELDHDWSLGAGGDGYDPMNLWPQIGGFNNVALAGYDGNSANSEAKDGLEFYVYKLLCPGKGVKPKITLAHARRFFTPDWYRVYVTAGRPKGLGID